MKKVKLKVYLTAMLFSLMCLTAFSDTKVEAASTPAQVTGVKQTGAGENSISLEWTALLDNGVNYQVDISTNKTNWVTKKNVTYGNKAGINNLNAGTSYYVRVRAYIKEWNSSISEYDYNYGQWSATLECVTIPNSKPSYLRKTASTTTTMSLEWGSVPGANGYLVFYRPLTPYSSEDWKKVNVTSNKTKLTKLQKNKEYEVEVYPIRWNSDKTFCSGGTKYIREPYLGVTPGKVTGVECDYYWQSSKKISVTYNTISSAEGYQVEVWTANKSKDKRLGYVWGDRYGVYVKHNAFVKHNMIKIRVRAYTKNYDGEKVYGSWSSWEYVCPQPDITKIKSTKTGMKLTWDKISGANRYVVYASTKQKSGYKKVTTTTKTSYTMNKFNKKALKKGKTYYFYVVAQKKVGKKYYSGEAGNATDCWYQKYSY